MWTSELPPNIDLQKCSHDTTETNVHSGESVDVREADFTPPLSPHSPLNEGSSGVTWEYRTGWGESVSLSCCHCGRLWT
jgi:hypothetical protein